MSSTYTDIIDDAMRKWNRVIKYTPYKIHVTVDLTTFSNANILGGAWITSRYTNSQNAYGENMTASGTFQFNTTHMESMKNTIYEVGKSKFYYVTLHEVGHIFGIGSNWGSSYYQVFNSYDNYSNEFKNMRYYIGSNGLREYKSYFPDISNNIIGLPIEDDGGSGTANVHHEERTYERYYYPPGSSTGYLQPGLSYELMTGYADDPSVNSPSLPMSRVTLGLLEDLGYNVNYSEAETYIP